MIHNHYFYDAAFILSALSFGLDGWGRFTGNWDAVGKMFFVTGVFFVFA